MHYSAGNQYERLYEAEGSDAALALMVWGYEERHAPAHAIRCSTSRARGWNFTRPDSSSTTSSSYYWQTRDAEAVKEFRPRWEKEARRLVENRTGEHGLFPKEQYCGDIHTPVQSINVNSKAWRALRDLSADAGGSRRARPQPLPMGRLRMSFARQSSRPLRRARAGKRRRPSCRWRFTTRSRSTIRSRRFALAAIGTSSSATPFRAAFFRRAANRRTGSRITWSSTAACAWACCAPAGMSSTFWTGEHRINPLYGTRYTLDTLRRDDPERALVSLYGMLAQGFTRNTFVCGEGCSLTPVDDGGRIFYCPPNSAANAHFLSMLRYSLVQDWDLDDDGKPETLRLLFATSRRWLEDGKAIKVERAPTVFGDVSVKAESRLSQGEVIAEVQMPNRHQPRQAFLRIRVPQGWQVQSAETESQRLKVDGAGTVDLSGLQGRVSIRFRVQQL